MSNWNPQADFPAIADALQPVTFVAADDTETAIAAALRRPISRRDIAASGGRLTQADVIWHLPQSELALAPRPGERIIDGGATSWAITRVEQDTLDSRWRCICRQSELAAALTEPLDWLQAAWTKDEHGALAPEWSLAGEDLAAVVQAGAAQESLIRGVRAFRQTFAISLATELAVGVGDRLLRTTTDQLLEVQGFSPASEVGGAFVIQAVLVREE